MRHNSELVVGGVIAALLLPIRAYGQSVDQDLVYTAIQPCRVFDTRSAVAGKLIPGSPRYFDIVGATKDLSAQGGSAVGCGVPGFASTGPQVQAVMLNLVAVTPSAEGFLSAWAPDRPRGASSVINFAAGTPAIANGFIVPVRQDVQGGDVAIAGATVHVVGDVMGYFSRAVRGGQLYLGSQEGNSALNFYDGGSGIGRWLRWNDAVSAVEINAPLRLSTAGAGLTLGSQEGNSALYFFDAGSTTGRSLLWNDGASRFELNGSLQLTGTLNQGAISSFNLGGVAEGNSTLYFFDGGSPTGRYLRWSDAQSVFELNGTVQATGAVIQGPAMYLGGPADATTTVYFFDGGSPTGRSMQWNDVAGEFQINGPLRVIGGVSQGSSASLKTDFAPVDQQAILERVASLPVASWRYKGEADGRHLGPTAEEFHAAFGLGREDGSISAIDADGVAITSIQALYELLLERDRVIARLGERLAALEQGAAACGQPAIRE